MVVVLAGGTGGAKLARGMLDVVGDELVVVANTGRRRRGLRRPRLPRPRPRHVLARRPHRRARLGPARRHLPGRWTGCASSATTCGSTSATATSRSACGAPQRLARGRDADRGASPSSPRRSACGARVLPMSDEPVRTRVRARGRWRALPGVHDPRARRGPGRGRRVRRASRRRAAARGRSTRSRGARAIVIGPSNPVISIGPILAVPGHARGAARPPPRRSSPCRPIVGGAGPQGPDRRRSWRGPGCRLSAAGIARAYDGPARRHGRRRAPSTGLPALETDTLHGRRRARARRRGAKPSLRFAEAAGTMRTVRRPAGQALRRRQAAPGQDAARRHRARRWPRRWSPTCWTRCAAPSGSTRSLVVTGEPRRRGAGPRLRRRDDRRPDDRGHSHAARAGVDWALERELRARAARARRLPGARPAEVDELLAGA